MAKIGPIFSIIFPATSTAVQPAVLNCVPFIFHQIHPYIRIYIILFGLGSSNITIKTYFGSDAGNIDAKVLILFLEYHHQLDFCAVPVFPPISITP